MLEGIHEYVLKDDSDHKSDVMASMIKRPLIADIILKTD